MTRQKNLEDDTTDVSVWSPHSVVPVRPAPREVLSGSSGAATTCLLTPRALYMMSDADTLRTPLSKYPFVFLAFES